MSKYPLSIRPLKSLYRPYIEVINIKLAIHNTESVYGSAVEHSNYSKPQQLHRLRLTISVYYI